MSSTTWQPKRTYEEADKILCAPGALHELENRVVDGQVLRVYKRLWPSMRVFWLYASKLHEKNVCVVYENQRLTFGDVAARAAKTASILKDVYGVKKGDRVAIVSRNYPEYIVLFWACHLLGAVAVLVNAWLPLEPLKACLINTTCTVVFVDSERANLLSSSVNEIKQKAGTKAFAVIEAQGKWDGMEIWKDRIDGYKGDVQKVFTEDPKIVPEDHATILFTSGTGGLPKGCLSTQRAFLSNLFNSLASMGRAALRRGEDLNFAGPPGPKPGVFLPSPLFHSAGTSLVMIAALTGFKLVLIRQWNKEIGARLMKEEMVAFIGGVQAMVGDMAESPAAGLPLRTILYGGAAVSPDQAKRAKKAFPTASLSHAYGLTETNATVVGFGGEDYEQRLNSCGQPMPVIDLLIMDANGVKCPTGTVGEVYLRGPNVMKEYWGDKASTSRVFTKDGWLKTGDAGYVDEEGFLYISDRLKDIIIRGGENIDSISVEKALHGEEGVLEAAAVGVPDSRLGELVTAFVTVKPAFKSKVTEEALLELARKRLPKFAVPVMIVIKKDDFVHTPTGKIIKGELKKEAVAEWAKRQHSGAKGKL